MKKIFIDCGFNKGQSVEHFINIVPDYNEYEIHAFEPDNRVQPYFAKYEHLLDNITFHSDVVWTTNEGIRFYYADNSYGNTVVKEKITGNISEQNSQLQSSVDLVDFIKNNFNKDDYLILKMDIEGGEYKLLEHIYYSNIFDYIDDFFVEFHESKVRQSLSENEHNNIIRMYKDAGYKYIDIAWEKENVTLNMLKLYRHND